MMVTWSSVWPDIESVERRYKLGRKGTRRITLASGVFDLLHLGHALMLNTAKRMGKNDLIVGIDSDKAVRKLKGPGRPVIPAYDRACMLAQLGCVNGVFVMDGPVWLVLDRLKPSVWCKGGDYTLETLDREERSVAEANGTMIVIIPKERNYSTTKLLQHR